MTNVIHKKNQRYKAMRTAVAFVLIGSIAFIIAVLAWGLKTKLRIERMDRVFASVQVGEHTSRVSELMGSPESIQHDDEIGFLSLLPENNRTQCTEQYRYSVQTFFLPISWLVCFDRNDRVIMKWRLD